MRTFKMNETKYLFETLVVHSNQAKVSLTVALIQDFHDFSTTLFGFASSGIVSY